MVHGNQNNAIAQCDIANREIKEMETVLLEAEIAFGLA